MEPKVWMGADVKAIYEQHKKVFGFLDQDIPSVEKRTRLAVIAEQLYLRVCDLPPEARVKPFLVLVLILCLYGAGRWKAAQACVWKFRGIAPPNQLNAFWSKLSNSLGAEARLERIYTRTPVLAALAAKARRKPAKAKMNPHPIKGYLPFGKTAKKQLRRVIRLEAEIREEKRRAFELVSHWLAPNVYGMFQAFSQALTAAEREQFFSILSVEKQGE